MGGEHREKRSLLKRLAVAVAILIALPLVAVVALSLLLDSTAVTNRIKAVALPRVSAALGREVTLGEGRFRLLPDPRVALRDLRVAGAEGEPPMVAAASVEAEVALWPLLRSLGREVRVKAFTLVAPELNLVRGRDGRWNFETLGGAERPAAAAPPPPDAEAQGGGGTADVVVQRASIRDGALRVVDRSAGGEAATALTDIDLDANDLGLDRPMSLTLAAALAGTKQNVKLDVKATVPKPLARSDGAAPGAPKGDAPTGGRQGRGAAAGAPWPTADGTFSIEGASLAALRSLLPAELSTIVTGGSLSLHAKVANADDGGYQLQGDARMDRLLLRGEPAEGGFQLVARLGPPARPRLQAEIRNLSVKGPGVDMGGTATFSTAPVRASFALAGPLLDLDRLLGLVPASTEQPAPTADEAAGPLVPPSMQRQLAAVAVRGTLDIGKLVNGKLTATDVKVKALLEKGQLTLEQAQAGFYGGQVAASGTKVDLSQPEPRWTLAAKLSGVDLGAAMQSIAGAAPVVGKLDGSIDLRGAGAEWAKMRQLLTGAGALALAEGALTTTDLGEKILGGVAQGLKQLGRGGAAEKVAGAGGKTALRNLVARFTVKDGFLALSQPLSFESGFGAARLEGRIGLDQRLDLRGTAVLPKAVVARALGPTGLAAPERLEVPLALGGALMSPSVSVDAQGIATALVAPAAAARAKGVEKEVRREGRRAVEGLLKGVRRR